MAVRAVGVEVQMDAAQQCAPLLDSLGAAATGVIERLDDWSARVIAAKAFPEDVGKRLAG